MAAEKIVIIGGSITGLTAALAFKEKGFDVTVIEQDPNPDESITPENSTQWQRRGAPHVMQPHFFLSGLRNALREWYPALADELVAAGVKEVAFSSCLYAGERERYQSVAADELLTFYAARRITFELVLRRFVLKQPNILFLTGRVTRVLTDGASAPFVARGVEFQCGDSVDKLSADIVVDCSGRASKLALQFVEAGAVIEDFLYQSKSAYYARHYRLLPGQQAPDFAGMPGVLFDDIIVGTFIADNDTFVMFIAVNKEDPLLFGRSMQNNEVFEDIVRRFPKAARWIETERAIPISPVLGWANMDFFWRTTIHKGAPQVLGYFPAGDALVRGNPKFGRGCTWGVMGSRILARVIAEEGNPVARIHRYERDIHKTFHADWEVMMKVDREDQQRFEVAVGVRKATIKAKFLSLLQHYISNIAVVVDPRLHREVVRGYYGITTPVAWAGKLSNWIKIAWAVTRSNESAAVARRFSIRPSREEIRAIIESKV